MADKPHWTAAQVADALRQTAGIKSAAARRLGCHLDTVDNYINRYPTVRAAYEEARGGISDLAESVVITHLKNNSIEAAKFVLTTIGKDRGWGHSIDVRHKLEEVARQIAEETGEPLDAVLPKVTDLASERRKRSA